VDDIILHFIGRRRLLRSGKEENYLLGHSKRLRSTPLATTVTGGAISDGLFYKQFSPTVEYLGACQQVNQQLDLNFFPA
jgi:hypothetical protein